MTPLLAGLLGIVLMLILMFGGVPVGFAMGLVGFFGVFYFTNLSAAVSQAAILPYSIVANYDYCVLPLFLLMANICFYTGMGTKLFNIAYKWTGRLPGGLAAAAIGACAMFGAVSASVIATTLTIGLVAIPEMRKYKYDGAFAAACVSAASVLGILIPPSGVLIIYGIITEQSIGDLFVAGIVPGILLAILFIIQVVITGILKPTMAPAGPSTSMKEKFKTFGNSIEIILLIIIVLAGLIIGWYTPTEAGAIGAFGAIVFSLIRKTLSWNGFKRSTIETISGAGMIYILLIGAFLFNTFMTLSTIPQELANIVAGLNLPRLMTMILILIVYIILGTALDTMPLILLTVPVFFPVIVGLGYDPIWFGIIIVLVAGIGNISPPVGITVFVAANIAKDVPMGKIFNHSWIFLGTQVIFAIILMLVPQIVTFLPKII
jgi:C4-dicarboxylate transporter, DctM subunit